MGKLQEVPQLRNKRVIECLEDLLKQANEGHVQGICFMVKHAPYHHSIGIIGRYEANPLCAIRVVDKLSKVLEQRVRAMESWG